MIEPTKGNKRRREPQKTNDNKTKEESDWPKQNEEGKKPKPNKNETSSGK